MIDSSKKVLFYVYVLAFFGVFTLGFYPIYTAYFLDYHHFFVLTASSIYGIGLVASYWFRTVSPKRILQEGILGFLTLNAGYYLIYYLYGTVLLAFLGIFFPLFLTLFIGIRKEMIDRTTAVTLFFVLLLLSSIVYSYANYTFYEASEDMPVGPIETYLTDKPVPRPGLQIRSVSYLEGVGVRTAFGVDNETVIYTCDSTYDCEPTQEPFEEKAKRHLEEAPKNNIEVFTEQDQGTKKVYFRENYSTNPVLELQLHPAPKQVKQHFQEEAKPLQDIAPSTFYHKFIDYEARLTSESTVKEKARRHAKYAILVATYLDTREIVLNSTRSNQDLYSYLDNRVETMLGEPNAVSTRKWTRYVSTNTQEKGLSWPQVYEIYEKEYDTLLNHIDSTTLSEEEKVLEKTIFSLAFLFSYLPVEERKDIIDFLDSDAICSFSKHSAPDSPIEKCKSV